MISPSALLRELAGSIEYSDSEDENDLFTFADDDDDNDADDKPSGENDKKAVVVKQQHKLRRSVPTRENQVEHELQQAVEHRIRALPATTCTICFDDVPDEAQLRVLECGHRFCRECLAAHIAFQSQDVARVLHKRATLRQLGPNEFGIDYGWVPSIVCPATQCSGLMCEPDIAAIVASDALQRFLLFAKARTAQLAAQERMVAEIDQQAAHDAAASRDALRQPNGKLWHRVSDGTCRCTRCFEWAVVPSARGRLRCQACLLPYCALCHISHLRRYGCFEPLTLPSRNVELAFIQLVTANPNGVKFRLCPRCFVLIEKNLGCDHHVCRACNLSYNWSQSPIPTLSNVDRWCPRMYLSSDSRRRGMIEQDKRTKKVADMGTADSTSHEQFQHQLQMASGGGAGMGSILI